jgi:hypothetical protein
MNTYEVYRALRSQGMGRKRALRLIGCAVLLDDVGWKGLHFSKGSRHSAERALAAAGVSLAIKGTGSDSHAHRKREGSSSAGVLLSGCR